MFISDHLTLGCLKAGLPMIIRLSYLSCRCGDFEGRRATGLRFQRDNDADSVHATQRRVPTDQEIGYSAVYPPPAVLNEMTRDWFYELQFLINRGQ